MLEHALLIRATLKEGWARQYFEIRKTQYSALKTPSSRSMFEAKLNDGTVLKRIVDAIKDLVQDVNLDIS